MPELHLLHRGCISSVYRSEGLENGHKVIKAYHKSCNLQPRHWLNISREVAILDALKDLRVPGVVHLQGTLEDAANMYLVFEHCSGGDLYKRLAHCGLLSEEQLCREVITPLLKVLCSLHELGVIHRDIKPENIFFDADGTLCLGDFGLAIRTPDRAISRVGTLDYMAPEVLAQPSPDVVALRQLKPRQLPSYDAKVDIWALGVLVYESLMGITPFGHPDPEVASLQAQFRKPAPLRPGVSAACADFVSRVLVKQAALRPTAAQLLGHPWVQGYMETSEAAFYSRATHHWLGTESSSGVPASTNITRLTSCPAAASPENSTPSGTELGVATADLADACTPLPPVESSNAETDSCSDRERFINLTHFLQQTLEQPRASTEMTAAPSGLTQQKQTQPLHALQQKQQPCHSTGQVTACSDTAAAGRQTCNKGVKAAQKSSELAVQRSTSAFFTAFAAKPAPAAQEEQTQPTARLTASPGKLASAAATAPVAATASVVRIGSGIICCSMPASPVADKSSSPTYWLLSPQQAPLKPYQAHAGRQVIAQQPAILKGLPAQHQAGQPVKVAAVPVYTEAKPTGQKPAILIHASAVSPNRAQSAQRSSSGTVPVQYLAVGGSPVANANSLGVPCNSVLVSPVAVKAPANLHMQSQSSQQQQQHIAGARGLVRHASAGLLQLHVHQPARLPLRPAPPPPAAARPVQRELMPSGGRMLQQNGSTGFLTQLQLQASAGSATSRITCKSHVSSRPDSRASRSSDSRSSSPEVSQSVGAGMLLDSCDGCISLHHTSKAAAAGFCRSSAATGDLPPSNEQVAAGDCAVAMGAAGTQHLVGTGTNALKPLTSAFAAVCTTEHDDAVAAAGVQRLPTVAAAAAPAMPAADDQMASVGHVCNATVGKKTDARSLWEKVQGVCQKVSKQRSSGK